MSQERGGDKEKPVVVKAKTPPTVCENTSRNDPVTEAIRLASLDCQIEFKRRAINPLAINAAKIMLQVFELSYARHKARLEAEAETVA